MYMPALHGSATGCQLKSCTFFTY
uniref:Uncharacterized protein n=1 Tax=Anguilla anguilla TaxID=7936 RepID=A0A0E9PRG9_ANGAN